MIDSILKSCIVPHEDFISYRSDRSHFFANSAESVVPLLPSGMNWDPDIDNSEPPRDSGRSRVGLVDVICTDCAR